MVSAHSKVDRNIRDLALNFTVGLFAGLGAYLTCRLTPYIPLLAYVVAFLGIFMVASVISDYTRKVGPGLRIAVAWRIIKKLGQALFPAVTGLIVGFLWLYQLRI
jgi:hypothetical protein